MEESPPRSKKKSWSSLGSSPRLRFRSPKFKRKERSVPKEYVLMETEEAEQNLAAGVKSSTSASPSALGGSARRIGSGSPRHRSVASTKENESPSSPRRWSLAPLTSLSGVVGRCRTNSDGDRTITAAAASSARAKDSGSPFSNPMVPLSARAVRDRVVSFDSAEWMARPVGNTSSGGTPTTRGEILEEGRAAYEESSPVSSFPRGLREDACYSGVLSLLRRSGFHKKWQRRWFILENRRLLYFKSEKQLKPSGYIILEDNCHVRPTTFKDFVLYTRHKSFVLSCDNREGCALWVSALESAIATNVVSPRPLPSSVALELLPLEGVRDSNPLRCQIPEEHLAVLERLGEGSFGVVHRGLWNDAEVAVKKIKRGILDEDELQKFKAEVQLHSELRGHPNIVQFLGICMTSLGDILLVTELMDTSLLLMLRQRRRHRRALSLRQILYIAQSTCAGMLHLSANGIIHRDLAARNLLLGGKHGHGGYIVKISDFGLSRVADAYCFSKGSKIPVRWSPPEAFLYKEFTSAGDVWSWAVMMTEVFSSGREPYAGWSVDEVITKVADDGYRLPVPPNCPGEFYTLLLECWKELPEDRLTWHQIADRLRELRDVLKVDVAEANASLSSSTASLQSESGGASEVLSLSDTEEGEGSDGNSCNDAVDEGAYYEDVILGEEGDGPDGGAKLAATPLLEGERGKGACTSSQSSSLQNSSEREDAGVGMIIYKKDADSSDAS